MSEPKYKHVTFEEAESWKEKYENDETATIESISLDFGRSYDTIRKWLNKVDTKMRPATGVHKAQRNKAIDGIKGKRESNPIIKGSFTSTKLTGHRRRSKY